jgi:hypothetical protein
MSDDFLCGTGEQCPSPASDHPAPEQTSGLLDNEGPPPENDTGRKSAPASPERLDGDGPPEPDNEPPNTDNEPSRADGQPPNDDCEPPTDDGPSRTNMPLGGERQAQGSEDQASGPPGDDKPERDDALSGAEKSAIALSQAETDRPAQDGDDQPPRQGPSTEGEARDDDRAPADDGISPELLRRKSLKAMANRRTSQPGLRLTTTAHLRRRTGRVLCIRLSRRMP